MPFSRRRKLSFEGLEHRRLLAVSTTFLPDPFENSAPKVFDRSVVVDAGVASRTPSVLLGQFDVESDPLSLVSYTRPSHGSVVPNNDGTLTYTPAAGFVGRDSFQYTVGDGRGGLGTGTMHINVVNPGDFGVPTGFTNLSKMQAGGLDVELGLSQTVSPRAMDYDGDGRIDILAGVNGRVLLYRNVGTSQSPAFATAVPIQAGEADISVGTGRVALSVVDMDSDGLLDLLVTGSHDYRTRWYRNTGSVNEPKFNSAILLKELNGINDHIAADFRVEVADWNGDGLPDILTGGFDGFFQVAYNVGSLSNPRFGSSTNVIDAQGRTIQGAYNLNVRVLDINRDGNPDFIDSYNWGDINYRINQGTASEPALPDTMRFDVTYANGSIADLKQLTDGPLIDFPDLNADGIPDLISGGEYAGTIYIAYGQREPDYLAEIDALLAAHPADLGRFLEMPVNAVTKSRLQKLVGGLYDEVVFRASPGRKQLIFQRLIQQIQSYPQYFKLQTLDLTQQPGLPSLAAQTWLTALMTNYYDPITRKSICDAAQFPERSAPGGAYRKLVEDLGMFLFDNFQSLQGAEAIYQNVRNIPRNVYPGTGLTMNDWLGGRTYLVRGSFKNGFNGYPDQGYPEFSFGHDARAVIGGRGEENQYMTVIHHEIMHDMDAFVRQSPDLYRRWGQLLVRAAGRDENGVSFVVADPQTGWFSVPRTQEHWKAQGWWNGTDLWWSTYNEFFNNGPGKLWNKLGFMRGDIAWFLNNPQESLATQGNQFWNSGEGRLQVAINRWYQGYDSNITEVLFFMDVLSLGLNKIQLCENDAYSDQVISFAKLSRNAWGYIDGVSINGREYRFTVDRFGQVTQILSPLAPSLAAQATAFPSTVTTTSTNLSVLGSPTNGDDPTHLIYTWTATQVPSGAAAPRFSQNATHAARDTIVEFDAPGTYVLTATITDKYATGFPITTSSTTVSVLPTPTGIVVSPESAVVHPGQTRQFLAYQSDQFGNPLPASIDVDWSIVPASGAGSIDSNGLYTAGLAPSVATIRATQGGTTAYATVRSGAVAQWINGNGGSWGGSANWLNGSAPSQADHTADFSRVDLSHNATVTLDGDRTAGGILFGDDTPGQNWELASGTGGRLKLDTSSGRPNVYVANGTAVLSAALSGNDGLLKTGTGTLKQTVNFDITGGITIDEGTYEIAAGGWYANPFGKSNQIKVNRGATLKTAGSQSLGVANNSMWVNGGTLQLGADNYIYDFRMTGGRVLGGDLQLLGGRIPIDPAEETARIESDVRFTYETTLDVGNGSQDVDLVLAGAILNPFSVTKTGAGTLLVSSPAVYTGTTFVNQGTMLFDDGGGAGAATGTMRVRSGATLGGIGRIASQLTLDNGARLIPKPNGIGQLTVGQSLSLSGESLFEIDPDTKRFDQVVVGSSILLGGTLVVTSLGGRLDANDTFPLFSSPQISGSFSSVILPPLEPGLFWDLSKLTSEGSIRVAEVNAPTAKEDFFWMLLGTSKLLDVLTNDLDGDSPIDPNSVSIVSEPKDSQVQVQSDGRILIVPDQGYVGQILFQYVVADTFGLLSSPATVRVSVVGSAFQNPINRYDVNDDRSVSPLDVLVIVNLLNSRGASLPLDSLPGPPDYVDVNGDALVNPLDILDLINFINQGSLGSGEAPESFGVASEMDPFEFGSSWNDSPVSPRRRRK